MRLTTRRLAIIGMLGAVSVVLQLTPLGFIILPFSPVRATIMHVPVIIAAIVEGPAAGILVGLIFGGFSIYNAAVNPVSPISFVFLDPVVAILPRLLIGVTSYYAYIMIKSALISKVGEKAAAVTAIGFAAVVGTLTNTIGVLSAIFLRHLAEFAEGLGIAVETAGAAIVGIGLSHGLPELIVAVLIVIPVVQGVSRLYGRQF